MHRQITFYNSCTFTWQWTTRIYLCGPRVTYDVTAIHRIGNHVSSVGAGPFAWRDRCESWSVGILWQLWTSTHYRTWILRTFLYRGKILLLRISNPCVLWCEKLDSVAFFDCCEMDLFFTLLWNSTRRYTRNTRKQDSFEYSSFFETWSLACFHYLKPNTSTLWVLQNLIS